MENKLLFVILDDDPTGIQTVQNCLLFTRWDVPALEAGFQDTSDFFFILTNTRACTAPETKKIIQEATASLLELNRKYNRSLIFIIRSDSTLRGHFPLELETVLSTLPGPVDGRIFAPVFIEGGRITENDRHYIREGKQKTECDQTEFACDSVFPYTTSHLPGYIEEKTGGKIKKETVLSLNYENNENKAAFMNRLNTIHNGQWAVVNSSDYDTLNRMAEAFLETMETGKTWIFQSSASLVKSITRSESRPFLDRRLIKSQGPGLIIAGSHVKKTTEQLKHLQTHDDIRPIELSAEQILASNSGLEQNCLQHISEIVGMGKTPLIFTSRNEVQFKSSEERQAAGKKISAFLWNLVKNLPFKPAFLLSKGGITSHDILTRGLGCTSAVVKGQAAPGVPVICMPKAHPWEDMPFIIFPGNVGSGTTLLEVFQAFTYRENDNE